MKVSTKFFSLVVVVDWINMVAGRSSPVVKENNDTFHHNWEQYIVNSSVTAVREISEQRIYSLLLLVTYSHQNTISAVD